MKNLRNNLFALMAGMFLFLNGAIAEVKIGYVDLQVALQKTSAGKAAKLELERALKSKKKELETKKTDLEKKRADLTKKKDLLSEVALQQKAAELQAEMMKYREEMAKGQMEIQKKERELTAPIFQQLSEIINKVAKEKSYDMILEKSQQGIVWAKKNMDLTAAVIEQFEKKYGKKK